MNSHLAAKPVAIGLTLVTLGWVVFVAGMMQIVTHPLQPRSVAFLCLEIFLSLVSFRLSDSGISNQGGIAPRLIAMSAMTLFGAALMPFWTGLAFSHIR